VLLRREVIEKDVRDTGTIGDERQLAAVGRPLRIEIEPGLIRKNFIRA